MNITKTKDEKMIAEVFRQHGGKCALCDNRAKVALASNVFDPKLTVSELRAKNFNTYCERCTPNHIHWFIMHPCSHELLIWEMSKDGTIKEL